MTNLDEIKAGLKRQIIEGLDEAFRQLDEKLSPKSNNFNDFIQIQSRYQHLLKEILAGTLAPAQVDLMRNQIVNSLLLMIDDLDENDFKPEVQPNTPAAAKRGEVLYRIPRQMKVGKEVKCLVRIAWLREVLMRELEREEHDVIKNIRVADVMSVQLLNLDERNPFQIRSLSEPMQFIDAADFTEWKFYVKPLMAGDFPLVLRVSVIEILNGKEYKKDIELEEVVVVISEGETVAESPEKDFSKLEKQVVVGGGTAQNQNAGFGAAAAAAAKIGMGGLIVKGAVALALAVIAALTVPKLLENNDWKKTQRQNSIPAYQKHLEKYPDGSHHDEALAAIENLETAIQDSVRRQTPFIPNPNEPGSGTPGGTSPATENATQTIGNQNVANVGQNQNATGQKPARPEKKEQNTQPKSPANNPPTTAPNPGEAQPPSDNTDLKGKVFQFKIPTFLLVEEGGQRFKFLFFRYNENREIRLVLYSKGKLLPNIDDELTFHFSGGKSISTKFLYIGKFVDSPTEAGCYFGLSANDLSLLADEKCQRISIRKSQNGQVSTFEIGRSQAKLLRQNARQAIDLLK